MRLTAGGPLLLPRFYQVLSYATACYPVYNCLNPLTDFNSPVFIDRIAGVFDLSDPFVNLEKLYHLSLLFDDQSLLALSTFDLDVQHNIHYMNFPDCDPLCKPSDAEGLEKLDITPEELDRFLCLDH